MLLQLETNAQATLRTATTRGLEDMYRDALCNRDAPTSDQWSLIAIRDEFARRGEHAQWIVSFG
jgi:hypothetical protein